jgi:nitrogen fixation protein FixH
VPNSYVASQEFDANRAAQQALGWTLDHGYRDGRLTLTFHDRTGALAKVGDLSVLIGRTTEAADDLRPAFAWANGAFSAPVDLAPGKWMVLLEARSANGTLFRQRLDLLVKG